MSRKTLRRIVALVPDAFGGRGGIALYLRHLLRAVSSYPCVEEVVVLPRAIYYDLEAMPANLHYVSAAAGSRTRYVAAMARLFAGLRGADLVICGHLHLLPFARLLAARFRCPVLPITYGVEAWYPSRHRLANRLCRDIDGFITIRRLTANRLIEWSGMRRKRYFYLPNCIDETHYGTGPKRADLLARFGIAGRKVVMSAGRLDKDSFDIRKGFDEIIEALPRLAQRVPNISYLIMGDGADRPRLEAKAAGLGLKDRVVFTGYIQEAEKSDYYRLADVFAMPGSGPLFDSYPFRFVFLEAMACGIPVVGSRLTDPSEADDPDSQSLLFQVNPTDGEAIVSGVLAAIDASGKGINPVLEKFYFGTFERSAHRILSDFMDYL